jgi:hypothetical protein
MTVADESAMTAAGGQAETSTAVLSLTDGSTEGGEKQKGGRHARLTVLQARAEAFASFTSQRTRPTVRSAFDRSPMGEQHLERLGAGSKLTSDAAFAALALTLGKAL